MIHFYSISFYAKAARCFTCTRCLIKLTSPARFLFQLNLKYAQYLFIWSILCLVLQNRSRQHTSWSRDYNKLTPKKKVFWTEKENNLYIRSYWSLLNLSRFEGPVNVGRLRHSLYSHLDLDISFLPSRRRRHKLPYYFIFILTCIIHVILRFLKYYYYYHYCTGWSCKRVTRRRYYILFTFISSIIIYYYYHYYCYSIGVHDVKLQINNE